MVSRRDVLTGGLVGTAWGAEGSEAGGQTDALVLAELQRIRERVQGVVEELRQANDGCATGRCTAVTQVRDAMLLFLRSAQKFPDQVEVATDVFVQLYDWHVRNRQPLTVERLGDGRYTLLFMFTTVVLRPDASAGFVGVPYDLR
jgi:hypothetical protein